MVCRLVFYAMFVCGALAGGISDCMACGVPVYPVEAQIRITGDNIRLNIRNNYEYWQKEVLKTDSLAGLGSSRELQNAAMEYINEHLRLSVDGDGLAGRLVRADFVQDPWASVNNTEVRFKIDYPFDFAPGKNLKINSSIFFEDEGHHHSHAHGHEYLVEHSFSTDIQIQTGKKLYVSLDEEAPEIVVALDNYLETPVQRAGYFFGYGFRLFIYVPLILVFVAVFLVGVSYRNVSAASLVVLSGLMSAGFVLGNIAGQMQQSWFMQASGIILIAVCFLFYIFPGKKFGINTAAACGLYMGSYAFKRLVLQEGLPRLHMADAAVFIAGFFVAFVLICVMGNVLIRAYKNRLKKKFESVYEKKFGESRRFIFLMTAIILGIVLVSR